MTDYSNIDKFISNHLDESITELSHLIAQPSMGAQNLGMQECADLVADMFRKRDFEVEIIPTGDAPVVFAERKGRCDKTLLFYNHYDVQPAEPWNCGKRHLLNLQYAMENFLDEVPAMTKAISPAGYSLWMLF